MKKASELTEAEMAAKLVKGVEEDMAEQASNEIEHVGLDVPGYSTLAEVLIRAYEQSAKGKGRVRHANNKPFDRQPILEVGRIVGPGFATGQVMKKAGEATQMYYRGEKEAAAKELLGVIVYAAAAVLLIEEEW